MSLLSSFIRNQLLKAVQEEIAQAAPQLKELAIQELRDFADEIIKWTEDKVNIDLNGDGKIGSQE